MTVALFYAMGLPVFLAAHGERYASYRLPGPYPTALLHHPNSMEMKDDAEVIYRGALDMQVCVPVMEPVGIGRQRGTRPAWGTVDGTLETITSHRRLAFTLYESHFGYPVTCVVRPDQEPTMFEHWRKFVRVSGLVLRHIKYGHPLEIHQISDVRELYVSDPDSYKKAAGLLELGGEAPEDLIRKLRDASA